MMKLQEFMLGGSARVLNKGASKRSNHAHQDRAALRLQYEKDLHCFIGGAQIARERSKDNDSYDE